MAEAGADPVVQALGFVAPALRALLLPLAAAPGPAWVEVRLRRERPVQVVTASGDLWPAAGGRPAAGPAGAAPCSAEDFDRTVQLVTRASVYAWEEELARGFCTLPGGSRVGFAGRAVLSGGRLATQRAFGSLCLRLARAIPGAADAALGHLVAPGGVLRSALVFGPPGCGKTTLLRDLCRQVSAGRQDLGLPGRRVGVVDERSEIAACRDGVPQFDLGPRADVLDGCPKEQGLTVLLRSMGPEVLATDEVGRPEDAVAIEDALHAGVSVLASAHAGSVGELRRRPALRALVDAEAFDRLIRLGSGHRVEAVLDGQGQPLAEAAPGERLSPPREGWPGDRAPPAVWDVPRSRGQPLAARPAAPGPW